MNENDNTVYINLLGEFRIQIGDNVVTDKLNRSNMMWNLLAYLVVNKDRNVPQSEFIDILWQGESDNSSSALKTLLYRTRLTLAPIFGEDVELILSQRGSYSWNRNLNTVVDIDLFTDLYIQTEDPAKTRDELKSIYKEMLDLYKGAFLPKLSKQIWLHSLALRLHEMYLKSIKIYAEMLIEDEEYDELANRCTTAITLDAFDEELHAYMVLAYLRRGDTKGALRHYEQSTDILYRNLGVKPSEKLRELYLEIMKDQKSLEVDLGLIQNDMREEDDIIGAFLCEPGFFREAYRLEVRRAPRQGVCAHLALMTVSTKDGDIPQLDILNKKMDQLLVSITKTLRRGDIVSRYSGSQYIFLLPTANYENAEMVMKRILRNYSRQFPQSSLNITYRLRQIEFSSM